MNDRHPNNTPEGRRTLALKIVDAMSRDALEDFVQDALYEEWKEDDDLHREALQESEEDA